MIGGLAAAADINGTVMTSCPQTDQLTIPGEAAKSVAHTGRALRMDQPDDTTIWVAPAIASGELLGSIAIVRGNEHTADRELNELQRRTLERTGMIMALLELMNRSTAEAELRLAGEVVADLVAGGERSATAARRARSIGFQATSPCVVIVAQYDPREASAMRRVGLKYARARAGLTDAHHDKLTVILPSDDGAAAVHDLWQILTDHLAGPVNVGGSRPTSEVEALPIANAEATRCLNAVQQLAGGASWGTPESLGFIGLILGQSKSREVHDFIRSTLGPLVDYDASRGTELVATVATYLRCERSLRSAARELHVHHNTILQRLQRAGTLLGEDWQTPERLLELQLALRLNLLQTESRA